MNTCSYIHPCEICEKENWVPHYKGPVRDGSFGNLTRKEHVVFLCETCGAQRLEESACKEEGFYKGREYRSLLGQGADAEGFWTEHDILQIRNLNVLWPHTVRNKTIADIGCAAGSFLDHIKGLARCCVAIEPCEEYHESLQARGYLVFHSNSDTLRELAGKIDFAFSFSVVEHVVNPREFLSEIRELLSSDGLLILSTPNRDDILMYLLGDEYKRFFYRTVHRWYFDRDSLAYLAKRAGFEVVEALCLQRFGISNAMAWLKDRRPMGDKPLPYLDAPIVNEFWKKYLESKGVGDYLYFFLKKPN